ncbi:LysR family transcriptional regulator (plasmid) [Sphingomonas paeninsulae]|uniref:LysR family transcriptional regulator n=1 Tax=Sphingomonas paeninsulae TaxID=2319844 RepID=A0A494TCP4_SPHPE|nr:LysR family transcriptional regulator [Sphingomonas paeninsulae]AYJ85024.1 LysR family transcriptional regulator [Sphingomonas paeninsulae]
MIDIDLNLLRVFDTLMELRSVTRAADRLSLTQSAISHALGRLRMAIGDSLFVRGPGGLQPTARALEIAPGVREGLSRLREAMVPTSFDPAAADRRFVLAAGTYFCALLVPLLAQQVRHEAPGVSLRVVELADDLVASLDRGSIDVALGAFSRVPNRIVVEPLYHEELVWIAAAGNPILDGPVDAETLAAQPRVTISGGRESGPRAGIVSEGGLDRQVNVGAPGPWPETESASVVYDSQTAITMVMRTDTIALVPRRSVLEKIAYAQVGLLETADSPPSGIELSMIWHRKQGEDDGLAWLRRLIVDAALESS